MILKFKNFIGSYRAVRRLSDLICAEHRLSVVENPQKHGLSYNKWRGGHDKLSNRDLLRMAIDAALEKQPKDFDVLLALLKSSGYSVARKGRLSLRHENQKQSIRLDSLGEGYSEQELRAVLAGGKTHKPFVRKKYPKRRERATLIADIEAKLNAGKGYRYDQAMKVIKLKQMVDSNVQRENVLPSEKARAYKMKLDAIKRKAGRPSKENSAGIRQNLFSIQKIANDAGEGKTKIQQYIKINDLIPELLEMVDGNEIKFNPAYELAFLRPEEQAVLYDILQAEEVTPSLSQAQRLKRASQEGRLSEQDIAAIMREEKAQTRDTGKVTLPAREIEQFFPKSYTPEQKKRVIVKLLASWARQRGELER